MEQNDKVHSKGEDLIKGKSERHQILSEEFDDVRIIFLHEKILVLSQYEKLSERTFDLLSAL